MKLYKRILSTVLAVIMILGSLASFAVVGVSAAPADATSIHKHYVKTIYKTPEEKLASMTKRLVRGEYALYVDEVSGEVALENTRTGDVLFSNPYDVASSGASTNEETGKMNELLSQIIVKYSGGGATNAELNSFKDAAMRGQIKVLNVKNGIRVEYTIGQDESRKLIPRQISAENFEEMIKAPLQAALDAGEIDDYTFTKMIVMAFEKKSLEETRTELGKEKLLEDYPICEKMDIYILKPTSSIAQLNWIESNIKTYCQDYTFEQMDADHEETGYIAKEEKFPLFKMALEYYLDDTGLSVELPCNGLRYDMSTYSLESISILPYMGAGNHTNDGYNFFPDGSGALINFKQLNPDDTFKISGKVYGIDHAYQDLSKTERRDIRYPVYGTVATEIIYSFTFKTTYKLNADYALELDANGNPIDTGVEQFISMDVANTVMSREKILEFVTERHGTMVVSEGTVDGISERSYKRGYLAVIEAGDSLAELEAYQGGNTVRYNTIRNYFNPMPKDTCYMMDALTGKWQEIPQTSDTKYTGSIKIHYQMLTDPEKEIVVNDTPVKVKNSGLPYYETTWFGMAEAYRDRLVADGTLTKLTEEDLEQDIPLYIEVFGTLETQKTVMTIPVNVMTPLTTFENVYDMYSELSESNVNNINFKLTGFANGGMYSTVPAALKWEKAVGGKEGFKELLENAASVNANANKNLGIFPDFDFAYIQQNTLFDSTNLREDALKTMDNRYSSKRQYSATQQTYITFYQLAMSPSRYSKFYEKLLDNLKEYDLKSFSVASLGHSLNSDFDQDDPYNREESKEYTAQAFRDMEKAGYSLMTESANAYTWGYVDHVLNVNLDSSRHNRASASVPFMGVVLHGYVQFAGAPLNEEGDINYAMLRAIENGAGLYFILSYQNTQELKKDPILSQYYSIRYDIWKEDVISYYNELNEILRDVQDKEIINHQFLTGDRVLDLDELEEALNNQLQSSADKEQAKQDQVQIESTLTFADAWKTVESSVSQMKLLVEQMQSINLSIVADYEDLCDLIDETIPQTIQYIKMAEKTGQPVEDEAEKAWTASQLVGQLNTQLGEARSLAVSILKSCASIEKLYEDGAELLVSVLESKAVIAGADASTIPTEARDRMLEQADNYYAKAKALYDTKGKAELDQAHLYNTETGDCYVIEPALAAKALALPMLEEIRANTEFYETNRLEKPCDALEETLGLITEDLILKSGQLEENVQAGTDEEEQEDEDNKHVVDNSLIAVVTYGTRENNVKVAYKSFILNYNNFSVTVVYEGITYTIPSGGYVMIQY